MSEIKQEANRDTREIEFNVSGMSCQSCEQALSMLLRQHDGVKTVRADAKSGKVQVTLNRDVDATELIERIKSVGYEVQWHAERSDCPGKIDCPLDGELLCRDECPLEVAAAREDGTPSCCQNRE